MCLTINSEYHRGGMADFPKPAVAESPIAVKKVFVYENGKLVSPYLRYRYVPGRSYKKRGGLKQMGICMDRYFFEGFYAYVKGVEEIKYEMTFIRPVTLKEIDTDTRRSDSDFLEFGGNGLRIIECTIPKGAKYYIGNEGDIVSDRIVIGTLDNEIILD